MLQSERHGTLFADHERSRDLYLRALWQDKEHLLPYSTAFDQLRKPIPFYDALWGSVSPMSMTTGEDATLVKWVDRYRGLGLSASLDEVPVVSEQSILQWSQEAVALLAWVIELLGSPLRLPVFPPMVVTRCVTSTSRAIANTGVER